MKKRRRRSDREAPEMEMELPMDVVMEEILTRLPAKSLLRFKCVSKLCSSLISSRYFINRFLTVPSHPRLYMCLRDRIDYRNSVTLSLAPDTATTTPSFFVVDHDLTIPRMGSYILQNLRGFMCYTFWRKPRIYNPATRQLVTLPAIKANIIPPPGETSKFTSYYFGHDPFDNQYKVLCSIGFWLEHTQEIWSEHWVFVLEKPGGASWQKVAPTPPNFCPHLPAARGVSINGIIYYLGWTDRYKSAVVSFDIRSQEFMKMIQVPPRDGDELPERFKNVTLIEYGGKVTIFDQTNLRDKGVVDLWVVEDAGNKEWSRRTLVLQPSQLHLVNNIIFKLNCTTQNGKVLLIPKDLIYPFHILCYDLKSNDMRKIEIKGIPDHWFSKDESTICFDVMFMDHSESLVYLET